MENSTVLNSGQSEAIETSGKTYNQIKIIVYEGLGVFYINGILIAQLDFNENQNPGPISIIGGYYTGDQIEGMSSKYKDYEIWEIIRWCSKSHSLMGKNKGNTSNYIGIES